MSKQQFYKKLTSFRIDEELREQAEIAAHSMGMTFSQFTRQSLIRNILVAQEIERHLNERNSRSARGLPFP